VDVLLSKALLSISVVTIKLHVPGFARKEEARRDQGKKTNVGSLAKPRVLAASPGCSRVRRKRCLQSLGAALLDSQDGFTQLRPGLPVPFIGFAAT